MITADVLALSVTDSELANYKINVGIITSTDNRYYVTHLETYPRSQSFV